MISGIGNTNSDPFNSGTGNSEMGKDEFMNLLIAQLKHQDPTNPMDNSQMSAQLAQFSQLEQLENMNAQLKQSIDANYYLTQSVNNTMTATLIGKDVKLAGNTLVNQGQESIGIGYNLGSDVKDVTVKIYNESGTLVKEITDLEKITGEYKLSWDFTDNNGSRVPSGNYSFEVMATSHSGETSKVESYKTGTINGVKFGDNGTSLIVGQVNYLLSDILEIVKP